MEKNELDLIVRGGTVVTAAAVQHADIGIADGRIVALAAEVATSSRNVIEARGLHVFPGVIDSHVHFNAPGRADWEGFETGSRALAAGGGTLFFDMPLNAHPPTLDAASFEAKRAEAQGRAVTDFALWGGLVPGNLTRLEELHACGVIGFKAFMCASGIDDFPHADVRTLREGMKCAASLKAIVAVHAESESMTCALTQERTAQDRTSARDYLDSRPRAAELEAIRGALDLAGETGCALHVVHVSCGEGVALIQAARQRGIDVTCETCPHYLTLTEEDFLRWGAPAKCAPPLRPLPDQESLWAHLGSVTSIGSDHSPAPADLKGGANFFKIWGGIAGVQHTLPLLLTEGFHRGRHELSALARQLSAQVAARFKLPPDKGRMEIGAEADLALVDLDKEYSVTRDELLDRHRFSPYVGRRLRGQVIRTLVRGETVFHNGKIVSKPLGRLIKPLRA